LANESDSTINDFAKGKPALIRKEMGFLMYRKVGGNGPVTAESI
jgi:hypothetical protein